MLSFRRTGTPHEAFDFAAAARLAAPTPAEPRPPRGPWQQGRPLVEVSEAARQFGSTRALDGVSLVVRAGEIRALLGPNGAGKTTLLRLLTGLVRPDGGRVRLAGEDPSRHPQAARRLAGLVPSSDRTFYLRISGLENLVFFGRLHGLPLPRARRLAYARLDDVGLTTVAHARVNTYSHGMQKRLAIARALLVDPPVLLVDEATHDLDPEGAARVRELVAERAAGGTAVLWTTQRIEEVRSFADTVTVLTRGRVRFDGTVPELLAQAAPSRHVIVVRPRPETARLPLDEVLGQAGTIRPLTGDEHLLSPARGFTLGEAIARLANAGFDVVSCRAERPEVEEAFLHLTGEWTA